MGVSCPMCGSVHYQERTEIDKANHRALVKCGVCGSVYFVEESKK